VWFYAVIEIIDIAGLMLQNCSAEEVRRRKTSVVEGKE